MDRIGPSAQEIRKYQNHLRFQWHETLLKDRQLRKHRNALVLAGYFMHRYNPDKGYAEVSINEIVRKLDMPRSSAIRARDYLLERGWIQIFDRPIGPGGSHRTLRYTLGGGPEDLMLEEHKTSFTDDTR